MTWFVYAILAAILMTVVNFGDKFVVESQVPDPLALIIFLAWFNLIVSVVIWAFMGFETLSSNAALILIIAGTAPAFAGFFYFQAVSRTEMTRIVILSQLLPVFTLVLSMIFSQESLTVKQFAGFVLILVAAIAVTMQRTKTNSGVPLAIDWTVVALILMTNLIYAVSLVLTDSVVENVIVDLRSLMLVTVYTGFGYGIGGLILYLSVPRIRKSFAKYRKITGTKAILSFSSVESIFVLRQFVLFLALSGGAVSLVSVIGSLNVFFAVIFGWILTLWQPAIFKEDISRSNLINKFLWAGVAFAGIALLS